MYAVMLDTEYMNKETFKKNFWADWKAVLGPKHRIQSLSKCDFKPIYEWHMAEREKKKTQSKDEKKVGTGARGPASVRRGGSSLVHLAICLSCWRWWIVAVTLRLRSDWHPPTAFARRRRR